MKHQRIDRVAELIKEELGDIIDQRLTNPEIPPFVSVHSVKVSKDLRTAEIYFTFLQDEDPERVQVVEEELNRASRFIRGELGRRIKLKYLPELRFHYNPSLKYAVRISEKLDRLRDEGEPPAADED